MAGKRTYKLAELAEAAGTSPRTVRYYVQRGLLEAPSFRGKDTEYTEVHLATLRAIAALQKAYLPLDEIAARVRGRSVDDLVALSESAAGLGSSARSPKIAPAPDIAPVVVSGTNGVPHAPLAAPARWMRAEIAPGLEVSLREDAGSDVVELFERLMRLATSSKGAKE